MCTDFTDIKETLSNKQTGAVAKPFKPPPSVIEPAPQLGTDALSVDRQRSPKLDRSQYSPNSKPRFEHQMETINQLVEDCTKGLGKKPRSSPQPVSSIFGGKV